MWKFLLLSLVYGCSAIAAGGRDAEGLTPLHRAAAEGNAGRVTALLREGADPLALDARMGTSPLHKAVYSGNSATVEILLEAGSLVDQPSASIGNTALHDAVSFRRGAGSLRDQSFAWLPAGVGDP